MHYSKILCLLAAAALTLAPVRDAAAQSSAPTSEEWNSTIASLDAKFARWMKDSNTPGLIWGIVKDGEIVHVAALGVQDVATKAPVSADTAFRIASMSKAFTGHMILKLRDQGKLKLDDPISRHIPEATSWAGDTTVADLLYHMAGFVTDDPWGDRQQPMPEAEFTALLKTGVPLTTERGTRFEYSNFGYALLGRIITNKAGKNYADYIDQQILKPLGMTSTTYHVDKVPSNRLARGYRWEEGAWVAEPTMVHGAFGAMGGIVTTGNDYAKWIAYLLKGMQHRDTNAKSNRALWDMQRGGGFAQSRRRPGTTVSDCRVASVYGAGLLTGDDCVLGAVLFHGGGFPGYGSHMLLIPATGTGIFALSNRTHAGPSGLVWDTATTLFNAGLIAPKPMETSAALASAYAITTTIWKSGSFEATDKSALAMNFLMDQSLALRTKAMNDLKKKTAGCDVSSPIKPTGRLSGSFLWPCEAGSIKGTLLLAPTATPQIQSMTFEFSPAP